MRRAKGQVTVHFVFVFFEVRQGSPNDQTSKIVTDESETTELRARARLTNVLVDLVRQLLAHIENVHVRILLIGLCT